MIFHLEPMRGFEPLTSSLPRKRSTPELHRLLENKFPLNTKSPNKILLLLQLLELERETGFEPATLSLEG
jgi:hypothetical protein